MRDFIFLHRTEFAVLIVICSILINILFRIRHVIKLVDTIIDDTLKVYDPVSKKRIFSGTKLTMVMAFASIVWAFHYDTIKNSKVNETLFGIMAAIATGVSIAKAYSKKLDPEVIAPDSAITIKEKSTDNTTETTLTSEKTS